MTDWPSSGLTTCRITSARSRPPNRPTTRAPTGRRAARSSSSPPVPALGPALGAPEDQAEQRKAQVALGLAEAVDPVRRQGSPAVGNFDLGQGHRLEIGTG